MDETPLNHWSYGMSDEETSISNENICRFPTRETHEETMGALGTPPTDEEFAAWLLLKGDVNLVTP